MSHHGSINENENLFSEFFKETLGKTGRFPDGKINEQDEGETRYAVIIFENKLIINFGNPVKWIGFEKKQVIELIDYLSEKVNDLK